MKIIVLVDSVQKFSSEVDGYSQDYVEGVNDGIHQMLGGEQNYQNDFFISPCGNEFTLSFDKR